MLTITLDMMPDFSTMPNPESLSCEMTSDATGSYVAGRFAAMLVAFGYNWQTVVEAMRDAADDLESQHGVVNDPNAT